MVLRVQPLDHLFWWLGGRKRLMMYSLPLPSSFPLMICEVDWEGNQGREVWSLIPYSELIFSFSRPMRKDPWSDWRAFFHPLLVAQIRNWNNQRQVKTPCENWKKCSQSLATLNWVVKQASQRCHERLIINRWGSTILDNHSGPLCSTTRQTLPFQSNTLMAKGQTLMNTVTGNYRINLPRRSSSWEWGHAVCTVQRMEEEPERRVDCRGSLSGSWLGSWGWPGLIKENRNISRELLKQVQIPSTSWYWPSKVPWEVNAWQSDSLSAGSILSRSFC